MFTILFAVVVLLLSVTFALAGLVLAQRLVPLKLRESHNAAIGIIYGALYVMFGVIVGFSAYLVLSKYNASQNTAASEAGSIVELHRLAEQLPEPPREGIQELVTSYARVVVDEEWPLMQGRETSLRAEALANDLAREIEGFEPDTNAEQALYAQALERVNDLSQAREARLLDVREGLPPILWVVLVTLGAIIILFTYFLGMEDARLHALAVVALTAGITFVILTIVALDQPFGELRVGPETFELALAEIERNSEREP